MTTIGVVSFFTVARLSAAGGIRKAKGVEKHGDARFNP
jgi:hypothetical protein